MTLAYLTNNTIFHIRTVRVFPITIPLLLNYYYLMKSNALLDRQCFYLK